MEMFDNHIRELVNGESIRIRFYRQNEKTALF